MRSGNPKRGGVGLVLVAALCLMAGAGSRADANEQVFPQTVDLMPGSATSDAGLSGLIPSLRQLRAPTRYLSQALAALSGVDFGRLPETAVASYNSFTNRITLAVELRDPSSGNIKPFDALSDDELATIYHELFHCYFARVSKPFQDEFYRRWAASPAMNQYESRAADVHGEAYAGFITETIAQYLNLRRMMQEKTKEARDRMRGRPYFTQVYEAVFTAPVYGYYYSSWQGGFVHSNVNLPQVDRVNILERLFDGELPTSFKVAFAESRFQPVK